MQQIRAVANKMLLSEVNIAAASIYGDGPLPVPSVPGAALGSVFSFSFLSFVAWAFAFLKSRAGARSHP